MPHVVTARCMDCRYTDCAAVCPVQCFWEVTEPANMLVIDPGTCIDCGLCIPECPINAIYPDSELPEHYAEWATFNAELFSAGTNVTTKMGPLPTAVGLDEIRKREAQAGWPSTEPSSAAH